MAWYNFRKNKPEKLDEEIRAFAKKGEGLMTPKEMKRKTGEGYEDIQLIQGYGNIGLSSFNLFYNRYINKPYENELLKLKEYRDMAQMTEIADVIEDATNESTQENQEGEIFHLIIRDTVMLENENIMKNLNEEFKELFYKRININEKIWDMFRSYFIDGRIFYERIIDTAHPKRGIQNIKKLPAESLDYEIDPATGQITVYFQYLSQNPKRPLSLEEAKLDPTITVFQPEQIGFINYGTYGTNKYEILGYLEKAKVPYNQLKLLETSVIIYRIVRAPERFVFRIDTGAMPMDKALKFVEKVKMKMSRKQSYDPTSGRLSQEPEVMCIQEDTEIPLIDGRYLSLKNIVKEHKEGKENWVYTINQDTLDVEVNKIKNAKITRLNEKLIRIWLDNGDYIDTTYDHKFILRDGNECRADKLKNEQSLMPLYNKTEKMPHTNLRYEKIYNPGTNKWRWTHRISAGLVNKDKVRHHKDFNRFNNNPTNLLIMNREEHLKFHVEITKDIWKNNYEERVESIRKGVKKWHSVDKNRKRHSKWVTRTNIEQNKVDKMQKVLNTPEVKAKQKEAVKKSKLEWFANEDNKNNFRKKKTIDIDNFFVGNVCKIFLKENRPKRNDLLDKLNQNKQLVNYLKMLNKEKYPRSNFIINRNILGKVLSFLKFNDYPSFRKNYAAILNHKISHIEYLTERSNTGCIEVENNHNFAIAKNGKPLIFIKNSMLENFYLPQSSDGRGSQIETVGGNAAGFTELDDIYYFSKKLYRSLKYPASRVTAGKEGRDADVLFGGSQTAEISRDEVKWAKFLERQQDNFCNEFVDLFLLHLDFKGLKNLYGLNKKNVKIRMNAPSEYKEQMEQNFLATEFENYSMFADREEISKSFSMQKYLHWDDETIKDNVKGFKRDKELGLVPNEGF